LFHCLWSFVYDEVTIRRCNHEDLPVVHAHALPHGDEPCNQPDTVGNSSTLLNLNILTCNGGGDDREVIMTLPFHTCPHANYLFCSIDIPLTGMTFKSLLQHPQSLVQAPPALAMNLYPLILHQQPSSLHLKLRFLLHQGHQRRLHQLPLWTHGLCHRSGKMDIVTRFGRQVSWNGQTDSRLWRCRPGPRQIAR